MRILRSIRSVNPAGGGPIEGIKQVARVLEQSGHVVEIVSLDSPDAAWISEGGLKVHAMGPVGSGYGYTKRLVPWLIENRKRFDAIIISGLWQYTSFGVWRAVHGSDTPYFVFPHGMLDPWFKRTYPLKHLKKRLYWRCAEYKVLRDAAAVLFTSEQEMLLARGTFRPYQCRERVISYGTAAPVGDASAQRKAFFERFPQCHGKRLLLFLSRIHEKKGCDMIIGAFAKAVRGGSEFHLVLAGPCADGYVNRLKSLVTIEGADIEARIIWLDMLTGDLKWGAFHAAEAFILPSHQENFGIAVAEALACGLPVLISNKVNICREIESDQAGFVENDDLLGTERLLARWSALGSEGKAAMRKNARKSFERRFEIKRTAESLVQTLKEATSL